MDDTTAGGSPGGAPGGDLLVDDPAVLDFLHLLQDAGRGPAPEIGAELAAVLAAAAVPSLEARRRRGPGRKGVAGVAVLGFMATGVGVAAADGLPRPVQRVVSEVVSRWTPFDLPHPDASTPARATPTPTEVPTTTDPGEDVTPPVQVPAPPAATAPTRPARTRGTDDDEGADDTGVSGGDEGREDSGRDAGGESGEDGSAPAGGTTTDGDGGSTRTGGDESDGGHGGDTSEDGGGRGGGSDGSGDERSSGGDEDEVASGSAQHD
ncbi:hypothetical protein [Phycicoccus avicenniae]|uniref:hypothetical protein n=1 Tax=Phycicoccus avicenniae TaxID=2828860 RepID=UPI003D275786